MGTGRRYTDDEKERALARYDEVGGYTAARELGIPYGTVAGWNAKRVAAGKPRRPTGAPTALTPDVQARAVEALNAGNTIQGACEYAGISTSAYQAWLTRADTETARRDTHTDTPDPNPDHRDREEGFVAFAAAVRKARADAKLRNVALIQRAAQGGAVLERRTVTHPDGRVEVTEKLARPEWTAAAWTLERTYTDEFGRRNRVEHAGRVDGRIESVSLESPEERRQAAGALRDDLAARRAERLAREGAGAGEGAEAPVAMGETPGP